MSVRIRMMCTIPHRNISKAESPKYHKGACPNKNDVKIIKDSYQKENDLYQNKNDLYQNETDLYQNENGLYKGVSKKDVNSTEESTG